MSTSNQGSNPFSIGRSFATLLPLVAMQESMLDSPWGSGNSWRKSTRCAAILEATAPFYVLPCFAHHKLSLAILDIQSTSGTPTLLDTHFDACVHVHVSHFAQDLSEPGAKNSAGAADVVTLGDAWMAQAIQDKLVQPIPNAESYRCVLVAAVYLSKQSVYSNKCCCSAVEMSGMMRKDMAVFMTARSKCAEARHSVHATTNKNKCRVPYD